MPGAPLCVHYEFDLFVAVIGVGLSFPFGFGVCAVGRMFRLLAIRITISIQYAVLLQSFVRVEQTLHLGGKRVTAEEVVSQEVGTVLIEKFSGNTILAATSTAERAARVCSGMCSVFGTVHRCSTQFTNRSTPHFLCFCLSVSLQQ